MTTPSHMRVTSAQREAVIARLQGAYVEGQLDKDEFDARMERAMTAKTGYDLVPLLADLAREPAPPPSGSAPVKRSTGESELRPRDSSEAAVAGVAHLLGIVTWFVGPLVVFATSKTPYLRQQASEALNLQLSVLIATLGLALTGIGAIFIPFVWITWFVLNVVGGVKAFAGEDYRHPVNLRIVRP